MTDPVVELARRLVGLVGAERASATAVAARLGLAPTGERTWEGIAALPGAPAARLVADEHGGADCLSCAAEGDRAALEAAFGRAGFVPRMPGADFERIGFQAGRAMLYADVDDRTRRVVALTVCRVAA